MPQTVDEFLDSPSPPDQPAQPITVKDIAGSLAPMTKEAAASSLKQYTPTVTQPVKVTPELSPDERFISENQRPGVPLYTKTEQDPGASDVLGTGAEGPFANFFPSLQGFVSPMMRYNVARRRTIEDQLHYAQRILGEDNARVSKDGHDIIVSVPDTSSGQEGKQKDVLLNEKGMSVGDLASLAAHWPEAAGALVAAAAARQGKLGALKGLGRYITDVALGTAGQQAGAALGDVATKLSDRAPGETIDFGEITKKRFIEEGPGALAGNAIGVGIGNVAGAVGKFAQAPFSHARTEKQVLGLAAAKRLEAETGVKLLYSGGEASGFPFLVAGESYIGAEPAGAGTVNAFKKAADDAVEATADALTKGGGGTDQEVGNQLVGRLQTIRDQLETKAASISETEGTSAGGAINRDIAKATTASDLTPMQAAGVVRSAVENVHDSTLAYSKSLFEEANAVPGATEPIAPTAGITSKLKKIKEGLPPHEVTKSTVEYNQYGGAMEGQQTTTEPIREFIHPEVGQFLNAKLDPKMSIPHLVEMRDFLWDEINRGEAVQGIPTRYLKQISHSITEAIDDGINSLPTGELKLKRQIANDFYKNKVLKFEEAGVRQLFKDIKEPGYVESSTFLQRTLSSPEQYFRVLNLVGPNSPAADQIRRQFARGVINKSGTSLFPARIDAQKFLDNLKALRTNPDTEDIYNDVFGKIGDQLRSETAVLGVSQGTISVEDAMKVVQGDKAKMVRISKMQEAQRKLDELKNNTLISKFTTGKLDVKTIDPEQFVESFVDTAKTSDLIELMKDVSNDPAVEENIRRKMTEKILYKAGPNLTDTGIIKALGDKNLSEKYRIVLGDRQLDLIKDLATALVPRRAAEEYAKGTGFLVKGTAVSRFLKAAFEMTAPTKEVLDIVRYKVAAMVITAPWLRKWISNTPEALWPDLTKAILVSTPFAEALIKDARDPNQIANSVQAIRKFVGPGQANQPAKGPGITVDQFLNQ